MLWKRCWRILLLIQLVLVFIGSVCLASSKNVIKEEPVAIKLTAKEQLAQDIDAIYDSMTKEERIAQLMFVGISGTNLNENDNLCLEKLHFGGVILFDRNMQNVEQVKRLNAEIQNKGAVVKNIGDKAFRLPLFSAVDAEGGLVLRMEESWPFSVPSQQKIGSTGNPNEAKLWAKLIGATINHMGFNINFAPVADAGSTYERSYSKDYSEVTKFVSAAVDGYNEENVICTLKHFPGIGRATVDPHYDGSLIKEDWDVIEKTDLEPFKNAINNKDNNRLMVMISHLTYLGVEPGKPSSISQKMITDILKNELGFKGLVVTDDLEMGAVSKHYTYEEMGVSAINAGADLALICHNHEYIMAVYNGLLDAYLKGKISEDRIADAVKKIIKVKLTCLQ